MSWNWKPQVRIRVSPHYRGEFEKDLTFDVIHIVVSNYAMVKKNMKKYLETSKNNEVSVFRHRRGEWGEWFESWSMVNGKPKIITQGWL